jgi:hypothetical protein
VKLKDVGTSGFSELLPVLFEQLLLPLCGTVYRGYVIAVVVGNRRVGVDAASFQSGFVLGCVCQSPSAKFEFRWQKCSQPIQPVRDHSCGEITY